MCGVERRVQLRAWLHRAQLLQTCLGTVRHRCAPQRDLDLGRSAALVRIWRGGIDDNGTAELLRHQQLPVQDVAAVPTYRPTYLTN